MSPRPLPSSRMAEQCEVSTPSPDRIVEIGNVFRAAKALLSAVELGVFTVLADRPLDLGALAGEIGIAERGARDFFDALVALGLLDRDGTGCYRNTPEAAHYLDAGKPSYIGDDLNHLNTRGYLNWHSLTAALRTGRPQLDCRANGYFQTLYTDEASRATFTKGMTGGTRLAAPAIVAKFPWPEHATVIDIGTAEGCLPVEIARAHPHITGGGFDLPATRPCFERYVSEHDLSHRLRFYPGDFLHDPLPTADVLVLGRVLHNWDLATKKMLLQKAYRALPAAGTLIVYERLIDDERRRNAAGLLASLNMLIMTGDGFDFTGADCLGWMQEAGFRDLRIEPLTPELSMAIGTK
jgi:O-methyltransferase domain/Dimerisation domain